MSELSTDFVKRINKKKIINLVYLQITIICSKSSSTVDNIIGVKCIQIIEHNICYMHVVTGIAPVYRHLRKRRNRN